MNFVPGSKVYVRYATGIMECSVEHLTISKYENNILSFEEKSDYYSVECHNASFYGFSYTLAGNVLVARNKWQFTLAMIAEKIRLATPARIEQQDMRPTFTYQFSKA